jgi:2-polyprenyl-3-methyl-5-hydroxy-6-metoxy-1,4-benzoquinol methylase
VTTIDDEGSRKDAERRYPDLLDESGRRWLRNKPFGGPPRETGRHLIDSGYLIQLLGIEPGRALRVCEIGCGPGWLSLFLARAGATVVGLDISPTMVAIAGERAASEGVEGVSFAVADMEDLPDDLAGTFDACVFYEALHHAPRPAVALAQARKLLRPGGVVLLSEPNWKHRFEGRRAARQYGVTENGNSTRAYRRMLGASGFVDVQRFHNNRKRLFSNSPADVLAHLAEPLVYRLLAPMWTASWLRARAAGERPTT